MKATSRAPADLALLLNYFLRRGYKQMTSLQTRPRQSNSDGGYYIAVGSLGNQIYNTPDLLSAVAPWASTSYGVGNNAYSTAVVRASTVGALFRDMGKTVVSSGTFFRKIQMVVPQGANAGGLVGAGTTSTFGVAGPATGTGVPDFYTGYIKLGFDGQGVPAPVAQFGR